MTEHKANQQKKMDEALKEFLKSNGQIEHIPAGVRTRKPVKYRPSNDRRW